MAMPNISYYKALRIQSTATPQEITDAYKKLSVLFNTDTGKNEITKEIGEIVREAFLTLSDPEKRAHYDLDSLTVASQEIGQNEMSPAEKIINSWSFSFSDEEQNYIQKIAFFNRVIKGIIGISAVIFIGALVSQRYDIAVLMMLALAIFYKVVRLIYFIKNPSPQSEVWPFEMQ